MSTTAPARPTVAYTGLGTKLLIDMEDIEQVQMIMLDHAERRLRARVIYREDARGQRHLRSLEKGAMVHVSLILGGSQETTCWLGEVRFCRTRISRQRVIHFTIEFTLHL